MEEGGDPIRVCSLAASSSLIPRSCQRRVFFAKLKTNRSHCPTCIRAAFPLMEQQWDKAHVGLCHPLTHFFLSAQISLGSHVQEGGSWGHVPFGLKKG